MSLATDLEIVNFPYKYTALTTVLENPTFITPDTTFTMVPFKLRNVGTQSYASIQVKFTHPNGVDNRDIKATLCDTTQLPYLVPGDLVEYTESTVSALAPPANPGSAINSYGIGVTPFPLFESGYAPVCVYFVQDATNAEGFPLVSSIRTWHNTPDGLLPAEVDSENIAVLNRMSIKPFEALPTSRWGINTAYKSGGSVILSGPSMASRRWVKFFFDPTWGPLDKLQNTDFDVSISEDVHDIMQSAFPHDTITGYQWYAHGYWDGADHDPYFVVLGRTFGDNKLNMLPTLVAPEFPAVPMDVSLLLPNVTLPKLVNRTLLGTLNPGEESDWVCLFVLAGELSNAETFDMRIQANII